MSGKVDTLTSLKLVLRITNEKLLSHVISTAAHHFIDVPILLSTSRWSRWHKVQCCHIMIFQSLAFFFDLHKSFLSVFNSVQAIYRTVSAGCHVIFKATSIFILLIHFLKRILYFFPTGLPKMATGSCCSYALIIRRVTHAVHFLPHLFTVNKTAPFAPYPKIHIFGMPSL